jgi:hypothetical protein
MNPGARLLLLSSLFVWGLLPAQSTAVDAPGWMAGVAKADITPDYPVRLSGYGSRRDEHEVSSSASLQKRSRSAAMPMAPPCC